MPELQPLSPIAGAVAGNVVNTPHPADVLDDPRPYVRHVVSVTEQHGLQHKTIEVPASEVTKNPFRPVGERVVADLDSFLAELDRRPLGDAGTLWGNATAGRLTAIYNDHRCIGDDGDDLAGWRDDKLTLKLVEDEDWTAWHKVSGTYFTQSEFGDLVESLLHTVKANPICCCAFRSTAATTRCQILPTSPTAKARSYKTRSRGRAKSARPNQAMTVSTLPTANHCPAGSFTTQGRQRDRPARTQVRANHARTVRRVPQRKPQRVRHARAARPRMGS